MLKRLLSVKNFLSFLAYTHFNKTFLERGIKKESKLGSYLKNPKLFSTFLGLKTVNHDNKIIFYREDSIIHQIVDVRRCEK